MSIPIVDTSSHSSHPTEGVSGGGWPRSPIFRSMMATVSFYALSIIPKAQKARPQRMPLFSISPTDSLLHNITWCKNPENIQEMIAGCPRRWLVPIPSAATESEKATYQALHLTYNVEVAKFHSAYQQTMQDFETTDQTWQASLQEKLHSCTIQSLKQQWPCLSYNEARQQFAAECEIDRLQRTNLLNRQLYLHLRALYEAVIPIRNEHTDGIPHPYLDKQIDHALKQAVFRYLQIKFNNMDQVGRIANHILQKWEKFSILPARPSCYCH